MSSIRKPAKPEADDSYDASLLPVESDQPAPASAETENDAAAAALRMDMLGAGSEGPLDVPTRRLVGSQNVLLLLVVLAAAGALCAMRFLGMGPNSSIGGIFQSIDYPVDKPRDSSTGDHRRVIAELSESRITGQVPGDQVQRNPFLLAGILELKAAAKPLAIGETPEEREKRLADEKARKDAADRAQKIQSVLGNLAVNSVMIGPVSVARINGNLARIGDTVEEYFIVRDIHGRGVVLEADGKTYSLEVPEGHSTPQPKARPIASPAPRN